MSKLSGARLVRSLCVALLAGCAGNGKGLDANGQPLGSGSGSPPVLTADFQSIQDNVFTPICVHCHSGAGAPEGLELDAAHSYALLVGVPSSEESGLERIKAGDPNSSYLVLKLQGSAGIVGAQMPFGGPPLPQATIDVIRQWISDGALPHATALAQHAAFAVSATQPADAAVTAAPRVIVVAFNHEVDATLLNDTTLRLERLADGAAASGDATLALRVAPGNPRTVLLTPAAPLAPGSYRVTLRGTGGGALADVDAQALGQDYSFVFTVDSSP